MRPSVYAPMTVGCPSRRAVYLLEQLCVTEADGIHLEMPVRAGQPDVDHALRVSVLFVEETPPESVVHPYPKMFRGLARVGRGRQSADRGVDSRAVALEVLV